jgi:hypothetical protein
MASTTRITRTLKVAEFADFYQAFSSMKMSDPSYRRCIELLERQTEAKQAKWWAYYDARQKVGA